MSKNKKSPVDQIDSKKQRILEAAQKCFARYGFTKTTLDDISGSIGMKKASLYYYYKNKEAIFQDVIDLETQGLMTELRRRVSRSVSPTEQLFAFAKIQLDYFRKFINLHDLSVQVIMEFKPIIDNLYQNFRQEQLAFVKEIVKEGIRTNEFKACDPGKTANAVLTIGEAVKFRAFQNASGILASEIDYSQVEQDLVFILDLLIRGIKK